MIDFLPQRRYIKAEDVLGLKHWVWWNKRKSVMWFTGNQTGASVCIVPFPSPTFHLYMGSLPPALGHTWGYLLNYEFILVWAFFPNCSFFFSSGFRPETPNLSDYHTKLSANYDTLNWNGGISHWLIQDLNRSEIADFRAFFSIGV